MKALVHPDVASLALTGVLHALADPVRLEIVRRLALEGELSCGESCAASGLPRATLSRHYDVLRAACLVWTTKEGVQYRNVLRSGDLEKRFPGLLARILAQQPLPRKAAKAPPSARRGKPPQGKSRDK